MSHDLIMKMLTVTFLNAFKIHVIHYFASEAERLVMPMDAATKCCPDKCLIRLMTEMLKYDGRFGQV